jgi:hypothetical protein
VQWPLGSWITSNLITDANGAVQLEARPHISMRSARRILNATRRAGRGKFRQAHYEVGRVSPPSTFIVTIFWPAARGRSQALDFSIRHKHLDRADLCVANY